MQKWLHFHSKSKLIKPKLVNELVGGEIVFVFQLKNTSCWWLPSLGPIIFFVHWALNVVALLPFQSCHAGLNMPRSSGSPSLLHFYQQWLQKRLKSVLYNSIITVKRQTSFWMHSCFFSLRPLSHQITHTLCSVCLISTRKQTTVLSPVGQKTS